PAGSDGQVGAGALQLLGRASDGGTDAVERALLWRLVGARRRISLAALLPALRRRDDGAHLHRDRRHDDGRAVLDVQPRATDDKGTDRLRVGDAGRDHLRRGCAGPLAPRAPAHRVERLVALLSAPRLAVGGRASPAAASERRRGTRRGKSLALRTARPRRMVADAVRIRALRRLSEG